MGRQLAYGITFPDGADKFEIEGSAFYWYYLVVQSFLQIESLLLASKNFYLEI